MKTQLETEKRMKRKVLIDIDVVVVSEHYIGDKDHPIAKSFIEKAINTTCNRPYLVKFRDFTLGIGDASNSPFFKVIKYPEKSSEVALSLSNIENDFNKTSGLSCGIVNKTTENTFSLGNKKGSYPPDLRNFNNSFFTFSSNRNLSCKRDTDGNIISSSSKVSSIMQSCLDMFLCERCYETCDYLFNRRSSLKHLQYLPHHYPGSFECRLAMTDFAVCYNAFADFDSHDTLTSEEIFKDSALSCAGENGE